ncbi:MAG: type IV pilus biogenesis/stability protein PilW [Pseudomonadales bacterium]|nr:type IV pilus biogenesis/stability protein PilW [Pseudomonadales bacterium]MBO7006468.1 type IV pilus biogenesis/stability protein PilW [Pseudomonadales bacterium]
MSRFLIVLATAIFLIGCSTTPATPAPERNSAEVNELLQRQMDLAVGYLRNRDYARAKEKLNRALEIDEKYSPAHATYGLLFQAEGEIELAEKYFKNAIRFSPEDSQARNMYGAFLFSEKRFHEAVKQLEVASENRFYTNRPIVFENLGRSYRRIGDLEGAEYAFTRAIQLNPEQAGATMELADIKFEQQNYVEARNLYRRYSQLAPSTARSLWLCVRLSRIFKNNNEEASCGEALEGIYPNTDEYRFYKESS